MLRDAEETEVADEVAEDETSDVIAGEAAAEDSANIPDDEKEDNEDAEIRPPAIALWTACKHN